jgi:hypothetical protein
MVDLYHNHGVWTWHGEYSEEPLCVGIDSLSWVCVVKVVDGAKRTLARAGWLLDECAKNND